MKQIASAYSYNKTTGVITLTGLNIDRDQLLLIVNTTRNVTYYNFADSATTLQAFTQGANTSLTLNSSVIAASSAHANGDALTIYYDDQASAVTANIFGANVNGSTFEQIPIIGYDEDITSASRQIAIPVQINNAGGTIGTGNPLPISGTVTANAGTGTFIISDRGTTGESTVTSFTSTSSAVLKASNANRKLLTVFNEGSGTVFILLGGGTASTTNYSLRLLAGDFYELDKYTGEVNAIFGTAGTAKITEIT
jgi:hypothetical protein